MIRNVSHVAIRSHDLGLTLAFYTRVLGFRQIARPASMTFPGAWLAATDETGAMIHVYAEDAAGPAGAAPIGEDGSVDHIAFDAIGFLETRERLRRFGLEWREQHRPGRDVWQIFVHDPSGTKVELSFRQGDDPSLPVDPDQTKPYAPDERFFQPDGFGQLRP